MLVPIITRITIQDFYRYNLLTSAIVTVKLIQTFIDKFKWFNLNKKCKLAKVIIWVRSILTYKLHFFIRYKVIWYKFTKVEQLKICVLANTCASLLTRSESTILICMKLLKQVLHVQHFWSCWLNRIKGFWKMFGTN